MTDGLDDLEKAAREFRRSADFDFVDPKAWRLLSTACRATCARSSIEAASAATTSWLGCRRLPGRLGPAACRATQPRIACAWASTWTPCPRPRPPWSRARSATRRHPLCHLRDQLGDKWQPDNEAEMVDNARRFSVEHFHACCRHARHVADPDGFDKDCAQDFERRWLNVDPMLDGMHSVEGVLDPVTGAAFRTALDSLAQWRGPEDTRNHGQRMADALAELLDHHLNEGPLPRRTGVRPHVSLTTTLH